MKFTTEYLNDQLKKAEQGDMKSMYELGEFYRNVQPKDFMKAFKYYRNSAALGYAPAIYMVGVAYETGEGVKQDMKQAIAWYTMAARAGSAKAQERLAKGHFPKMDTSGETAY